MIGRVRLKSKSAAFSKAREGGAKTKEREVAARVMDLSFESWSLRFGVMVWREGSLGVEGRELVGTRIMGFEEAMIIEAIAMREGGFGNGGGLSEFFATQFQRLE
ncbi:hypothetical protein MtrunA17_Chr3g0137571 [Medicago truncatula]|uniref:Uncharacterized protein n=1 Tax=Medicago truncatula TaxID=3880 RepID=A0A396J1P8_MEDTR|nr:hypothetical protein MtrunA17_Chr3g0137571 [Medicago truncatula]